jgi:hypothetical protein
MAREGRGQIDVGPVEPERGQQPVEQLARAAERSVSVSSASGIGSRIISRAPAGPEGAIRRAGGKGRAAVSIHHVANPARSCGQSRARPPISGGGGGATGWASVALVAAALRVLAGQGWGWSLQSPSTPASSHQAKAASIMAAEEEAAVRAVWQGGEPEGGAIMTGEPDHQGRLLCPCVFV